jgi:hypothetical protein
MRPGLAVSIQMCLGKTPTVTPSNLQEAEIMPDSGLEKLEFSSLVTVVTYKSTPSR